MFCSKCGSPSAEDDRFCSQCNNPLQKVTGDTEAFDIKKAIDALGPFIMFMVFLYLVSLIPGVKETVENFLRAPIGFKY